MRVFRLVVLLLAGATAEVRAQDFLERLDESLTITAFGDNVRARLSGTLDLEYYHFNQPPPGLIDAAGHDLFSPRLTMFLDAQIGPHLYFFSQARLDRHFDPTDHGAQVRLDEYALRFTPWKDGRLSVQIGKFATVISKWAERHLSWDNPFINAPLVYENITPLEDMVAPYYLYGGDILDDKYEYIPVIWGPSYASGASVAGRLGMFEYAGEIKNAALASRPESWDATRIGFAHPTWSGRVGLRPNERWNFGFSASDGSYFRPEAEPTLPLGSDLGDYHETVLGQDVSFAWRHLQIWAEFHEARFEVPRFGDADTFAYFIEAKYKITPQLFGALRWNQQFFGKLPDGYGGEAPWGHDLARLDLAAGYRFTEHTQLKVQYYLAHTEHASRELSHSFGAQFTVRF